MSCDWSEGPTPANSSYTSSVRPSGEPLYMREEPDGPEPEGPLRFSAIRALGLELSKR